VRKLVKRAGIGLLVLCALAPAWVSAGDAGKTGAKAVETKGEAKAVEVKPEVKPIVWPAPPDVTRIRYLMTLPSVIEAPKVVPKNESFLSRTGNFLKGVGAKILGVSARFGVGGSRGGKAPPPLLQPTGVWVSGKTAFIADLGLRTVVACSLETGICKPVSFSPDPEFKSPVGVAVTSAGKLFVSDSVLGRVFMYGHNGKLLGELDKEKKVLVRPTGLALDEGRNRFYVSDTGAHKVHVFTVDGKYLSSMGGRGGEKGQFNFPTYISVEPRTGRLLVCDSANFRIQMFRPDGSFDGMFGSSGNRPGFLPRPRGLAADSDGNVYSVDGALDAVQIFNKKGQLLLYFGSSGSEHGNFTLPGGIFIDGQNRVYVADTQNARIEVFEYLTGRGK